MDIDSFLVYIITDNTCKDIAEDVETNKSNLYKIFMYLQKFFGSRHC